MLHVFSAGNYGRVSLQRADTSEPIEAEVARDRLHDLDLKQGDNVFVVFRHVRLFPRGRFAEADVRAVLEGMLRDMGVPHGATITIA